MFMDDMISKIVTGVIALVVFAIVLPIAVDAIAAANFSGSLKSITDVLPVILGLGVLIAIVYAFVRKA
jgi:hypothetical protein